MKVQVLKIAGLERYLQLSQSVGGIPLLFWRMDRKEEDAEYRNNIARRASSLRKSHITTSNCVEIGM